MVHSVGSSEELGETVKLVSNCQETIGAAPGAGVGAFIHQHELCARQPAARWARSLPSGDLHPGVCLGGVEQDRQ